MSYAEIGHRGSPYGANDPDASTQHGSKSLVHHDILSYFHCHAHCVSASGEGGLGFWVPGFGNVPTVLSDDPLTCSVTTRLPRGITALSGTPATGHSTGGIVAVMKSDLDKRRSRARHMSNVRRWGTRTLLGLAALVLFLVLPVGVWKGPYLLDGQYLDTESIGEGAGSAALVTGLRTAMVTCVASIGAGIALFYTARNYRLNHRGQVTDRFTKALERLDSEHIYVRVGGILALEQIVQDAPEQAAHAAHVLGHFVRHMRPPSSLDRPDADIQAALTALTRPQSRTHINSADPLDLQDLWLTGAQLNGADLTDAWLDGANLSGAWLDGANLSGARLDGANLSGARLSGADLREARLAEVDLGDAQLLAANLASALVDRADLTRALLGGADLTRARLDRANLTGALLDRANLTRARLSGANLTDAQPVAANLTGAILVGADLTSAGLIGANLSGARLFGANLTRARLIGADLTDTDLERVDLSSARLGGGADLSTPWLAEPDQPMVRGLTVEQVLSATSLTGVRLPPTIAEDPRVAAHIEGEPAERLAEDEMAGEDDG